MSPNSSTVEIRSSSAPARLCVVGGGVVGLAFALAAARRGIAIRLFAEGFRQQPAVRAERFERRVYALSPSSRAFLRDLEVWSRIDQAFVGIGHDMRIWAAGVETSTLHLSAYQANQETLAFIVGDDALTVALAQAVAGHQSIEVIDAQVTSVTFEVGTATVFCGELGYNAEMVVGADGVNSLVRECASIPSSLKPMGATGVVATFDSEFGHQNCACQWFTDQGVIALLPLPGNAVSLVWSAPDILAEDLGSGSPQALADRLSIFASQRYGKLTPISPISRFPLSRLSVSHMVSDRVALLGDAAHVIHPLAGQGLNLGLDDARVLAEVLADREFYRGLGEKKLLRRYERRRAEAVMSMGFATDGLFWLFGSRRPGLARVAATAMGGLDRMGIVKSLMMQAASHNAAPDFLQKDV